MRSENAWISKKKYIKHREKNITRSKQIKYPVKCPFIDAPARNYNAPNRKTVQMTRVQPLMLPMHGVFKQKLQ